MFHLLVSYQGWGEGAGSISTSRVYINPNNSIGKLFLDDSGKLDIAKVNKIPALLVTEIGGSGSQFAKVAHITNVVHGSNETSIQYIVDNSIRPISNQDLESFSTHLGLGKFPLTHTSWTIKDSDLFKILLTIQQGNSFSPKVFSFDSIGQQRDDLVSVMMPFSADFNAVYAALQGAASSMGLTCMRADDLWEHHTIIQDIVNLIGRARIVICDCSGRNPNVFYEAGIAHSFGKEVILIAQSESDVPFDLLHHRYVRYLNNGEGLTRLSEAVQSRMRTLLGQN